MKISAIIITKNEEKNIHQCITSVSWCDEIIIIDDNSSDSTVKIAKKLGALIYNRTLDNYANQKNFGIDKASNDWVLVVDADERISEKLQREIKSLNPTTGIVAYSMPFKNYLGRKWLQHGGLYPDRHTRLFDRRFARYLPTHVHEQLDINGQTKKLRGDYIHYTYRNAWDYLHKVRRYARLEALDAKVCPTYRHALKTFYRKYIKLQGYKDGWAGLVSAKLLAYYELVKRRAMRKGT